MCAFVSDLVGKIAPLNREEWLNALTHFVPVNLSQWAVLVALISWSLREKERRNESITRAWREIRDAHGKPGDGGRVPALELLNNSNGDRRYPWFWLRYPKEDLAYINLSKVNLYETNLQGAKFNKAIFQEAVLHRTNLKGAFLHEADLQKADLWRANLQGASLWRANLQGANLEGADLRGAELGEADLKWAELIGANLKGADLYDADLQGAKYNSKLFDFFLYHLEPTLFPDGFNPKAHGMIDWSAATPNPQSSGFFAAVGG